MMRIFAGGALALALTSCATSPRPSFAAPAQDTPPPLIAVGDLHGDYDAFATILGDAGLMDEEGCWIGGEATLVQLGDIADRGPDTRRIITDLRRLQSDAKAAGGKVVVLVGNHEAMNMTGDLRYVHPGEYAAFADEGSAALRDRVFAANRDRLSAQYRELDPGLSDAEIRDRFDEQTPLGQIEHQRAWAPDGEIGRWVSRLPAIAEIDGTLFAHGGLSVETAERGVKKINRDVRRALSQQDADPDSIINRETGPLWYRGLSGPETPEGEAEVAQVLAATGARRIVLGHTPSRRGIRALYGGRVIVIDTGASAHYGGTRSFLSIQNGRVTAHDNGVERAL